MTDIVYSYKGNRSLQDTLLAQSEKSINLKSRGMDVDKGDWVHLVYKDEILGKAKVVLRHEKELALGPLGPSELHRMESARCRGGAYADKMIREGKLY